MAGLFNTTIASGITDRVAAIVSAVDTTLVAARSASAPGGLFNRVSTSQTYEVERDFITPCYNFETSLSGASVFGSVQITADVVNALDIHCQRTASVSFDTFLNNSGLQVSEHFAKVWGQVKSSQLTAHNVFAEETIQLASITRIGGGGNWTLNAGQNLGPGGTAKYESTTPVTGEQKILASLPSGISTSSCTMSVSGLDDAGHVQQSSFSFANATPGATALVSSTLKYRTITNVNVVSDTGITNGIVVTFTNSKERVVTY